MWPWWVRIPIKDFPDVTRKCIFQKCIFLKCFLASQDALEVMRVTDLLTNWLDVSIDFTDVTLVSDDTYRRLYWCDPDYPDDPDESYLVMKVIYW